MPNDRRECDGCTGLKRRITPSAPIRPTSSKEKIEIDKIKRRLSEAESLAEIE
jgi:hypothetical protein